MTIAAPFVLMVLAITSLIGFLFVGTQSYVASALYGYDNAPILQRALYYALGLATLILAFCSGHLSA